ncbi:hypothetical protein J6590_103835 [Homalodisca vitripennis]|nr:hypothetical protein J6590_103835 [Homalodisca vitripennis]
MAGSVAVCQERWKGEAQDLISIMWSLEDEEEEDLMFSPALMARRASESWINTPPVEVQVYTFRSNHSTLTARENGQSFFGIYNHEIKARTEMDLIVATLWLPAKVERSTAMEIGCPGKFCRKTAIDTRAGTIHLPHLSH